MSGRAVLSRLLQLRCREASELSSLAIDEPLGTVDDLALRGHMLVCASCRNFDRQVRAIHDALGQAPALESPNDPPLPADVRRRLESILRSARNGEFD